jgi:aldehyde dehydrogenase (NAD+)
VFNISKSHPVGRGAATRYLEPAIFTDVKPDNVLMEEEIFGPLLPIVDCDTIDEAVSFVNARPKPLALYVFSENSEAVDKVLKQTSSGGACVNNAVIHLGNHHLPFGGIGPSGLGSYHGHFGFKTFSHEKAVLRQGRFSLVKKLYPPYAGASKFLQRVMHWFE